MRQSGLSIVFILLLLSLPRGAWADWVSDSWDAMGTRIHTEFESKETEPGRKLIGQMREEFARLEALLSPYIESSELSLVNREAAGRPVRVSKELFDLLEKSRAVSELSHGAFDITYASVGRYYDYRKKQKPSSPELEAGIRAINYRYVELDADARTVSYSHQGVYIDLGGIAKGYAVDQAIDLLRQAGIESGMVSAGGDTRLLGLKKGKPWIVGIKDPRNEERNAVVLPLDNTAMSTSGDYERYFIEDGIRYHHIISPQTGQSAREVQSVSVLGPDATTTDALSTTVFVLGVTKGLNLINSLPGIDAIIVDQSRRLHYSEGLKAP